MFSVTEPLKAKNRCCFSYFVSDKIRYVRCNFPRKRTFTLAEIWARDKSLHIKETPIFHRWCDRENRNHKMVVCTYQSSLWIGWNDKVDLFHIYDVRAPSLHRDLRPVLLTASFTHRVRSSCTLRSFECFVSVFNEVNKALVLEFQA